MEVTKLPQYLRERRRDVHSEAPWSQFRHVSRQLRTVVSELISLAGLEPGAVVLDFGCANAPYRDVLPEGVVYVGADLPGNPVAEVELRPDGTVPLPDASCDLVLSTQVLEHVEDPVGYADECYRLLRPGGTLVLSTHGIMYYHRDPEDYWRWTRPGLTKVLTERGFRVDETRGVLALAPAALQILQDGTIWKLPRRLQPAYALVMQTLITYTDRRYDESVRVDNCLVIAVQATRPS
jgi:SAM-dependent methyltransferase